jgi:predicted AAA+ superfamily ATPase
MIKRQKYIELFRELFSSTGDHILILGEKSVGKSTFLRDLESDGIFGETSEYTYIYLERDETLSDIEILWGKKIVIIDTEEPLSSDIWERFISDLWDSVRVIATAEESVAKMIPFVLPTLSFREFAEHRGKPVEIQRILAWEAPIDELNELRDIYIERGAYPEHIVHPESISSDFEKKRSIIESELFEKERWQFLDYVRTLAMNVGNPFKADALAKMLDISRRKVNKYTELLMMHGIIKAIGPWSQNTETETTRHVKIYFMDLSFLKALLGDIHYQWTLKSGTIENFIFLELDKKLDATHTISYYRKKSGAEITFILEDEVTGRITPIEVTPRETDVISQAFRTFDLDYHDRVERYMLVNGRLAGKKDLSGTLFITIPHIAI